MGINIGRECPHKGWGWRQGPAMKSFVALLGLVSAATFDIGAMLQLANEARGRAGAKPLALNDKLTLASQRHSADQASMRRMTHVGSDGSDFARRCLLAGYNYRLIAENIAAGQRNVSEVMQTWLKNKQTYALIVDPRYRDFGAGMVDSYWTQNIGSE